MRTTRRSPWLAVAVVVLLAAAPARAAWIAGTVYCDDGDGAFSAGDTPLDGVVIKAVSRTAEPGFTLTDVTGDDVPVSPAEPGYYLIMLPHRDDNYVVMPTGEGVPAGAFLILPASGAHFVALDLDVEPWKNARNFLFHCGPPPTTSTTHQATTTSTSSTSTTSTSSTSSSTVSTSTTVSTSSTMSTSTTSSSVATTVPSTSSTSSTSTTVTSTSSTTRVTTPLELCEDVLDHFKCYRTRRRSRFQRPVVSLADQFESGDQQLVRPYRLCNPVDKEGEGINDPTAHAMCYRIRDATSESRFRRREIEVENQFGTQILVARRPDSLCVPAEKDDIPSDREFDRLKCYRVSQKVRAPEFEERVVTLEDQFESKETVVLEPRLVCNPADLNDEGVDEPSCHLVCYKIRDEIGQPDFQERRVTVTDEFSSRESTNPFRGACRQVSLLCVPSLKTELD